MDSHDTTLQQWLGQGDTTEPALLPAGEPGERLGRYQVTGQLGAGGMGVVLDVHDPELGRPQAAKVIRGEAGPRELRKFFLEAQVTGQLEHPNIVPVHELDVAPDGRLFFTMRRIEGQELGPMIRGGAPLVALLQAFLRVCDAIGFAHSRGVIHRDLKPANVMVGEFGEVLVCDWGLARRVDVADDALRDELALDAAELPADPDSQPLATLAGAIVGTPAYMPPEQAGGRIDEIDRRSDIYALGAILYELLAGAPPYSGPNAWAVLAAVLDGPPVPPSERAPEREVPWELEAAARRAMASKPEDRYQDVGALRDDVERYLTGGVLDAARYSAWQRALKWARRHRLALAAIAALLLGGVAVAAVLGVKARGERRARLAQLGEVVARAEALKDEARALVTLERGGNVDRLQETPERRKRRALLVRTHLEAVSALDEARTLSDDEALRSRRLVIGQRLARLALVGGDASLARWALARLKDHGAAPARIEREMLRVERTVARAARQTEARLAVVLDDIGRGLRRPEREPDAPTLEDYVWEVAAYREQAVVERLGTLLDDLATRAGSSWTSTERDRARFACEVLGRIGLPNAAEPLMRWLAAARDHDMIVVAGRALCRTRDVRAYLALVKLRRRIGLNSSTWKQVLPNFRLVPRAKGIEEGRSLAVQLYNRGMRLEARGRHEDARKVFDRAIELRPRFPEALNARAAALKSLGERDAAMADYDRAIALDGSIAMIWANRGMLRMDRGDAKGAIADADRAVALAPDEVVCRAQRASILLRAGRVADAAADATTALNLDPRAADVLRLRAECYLLLGDFARSLADSERAVELVPDSPNAWTTRAQALSRLGRATEAITAYTRAFQLAPDRPRLLALRAIARLSVRDFQGALADADRALGMQPDLTRALLARSQARRQTGDAEGALADADALLKQAPAASNHAVRAQALSALKRHADAAKAWGEAIAREEKAAVKTGYLSGRAQSYAAAQEYEKALADYDRALAAAPRNPGYLASRGSIREKTGNIDGAIEDYGAVLQIQPGYLAVIYRRSVLLQQRGRTAELARQLDALRGIAKQDWRGAYMLGRVLAKLERPADALAAYRDALGRAPENKHDAIRKRMAKVKR